MYKGLIVLLAIVASATAGQHGEAYFRGSPVVSKSFCQGCRSIVSFWSIMNSTTITRSELKDILTKYCEIYYEPSTDYRQGPCPIFVEGFFYITDRIDAVTHCDEIGACKSGPLNYKSNQITPQLTDGIVCDVCENAVVQVREQLQNPKVVAYLHSRVNDLCDYLRVIGQDDFCRHSIDKYVDDFVDFVQQLDPLKYCRSISLCNRNESLIEEPQEMPTLSDIMNLGIETSVRVGAVSTVENPISKTEAMQSHHHYGPNCLFCKTFVKEMFKFVRENRTEEGVKEGLDKVCQVIYKRGPKLHHCEQLVSTYSREMIDLLVDETNPELICMMLNQCTFIQSQLKTVEQVTTPSSDESEPAPTLVEFMTALDPSIKRGSVSTCVECKLFIKYLRNNIEDPNSELRVKEFLLKRLCDSIEEEKLSNKCKVLIEQYSDVIFRSLVKELNPREACIDLGACTRRPRVFLLEAEDQSSVAKARPVYAPHDVRVLKPLEVSSEHEIVKQMQDGMFCPKCIEIVTQIDEYLSTHPVDHDVSTLIDEVCNKLPNEMAKQECTILVKTFGEDIAHAIATMQNPRQLCNQINLC